MAINVAITVFRGTQPTTLCSVVERYELKQAMAELFELVAEIHITDPALDLTTVMGVTARVDFNDEPFLTQLEGIVRSVHQLTSEPTGVSRYEVRIVPPLWLTTRRRDHRIFQDKTVFEIVSDVLAQYGDRIPAPVVLQTLFAHPKREYTVQYGETDHDFVLRILAEEGVSSYFDHLQGTTSPCSVWTLSDDTTIPATIGGPLGRIPFVPPSGQIQTQPHVFGVQVSSGIETTLVTLRDYDFEKPEHILENTAVTRQQPFENEGELESYTFAQGRFSKDADGTAVASQWLEEERALRRLIVCQATFDLPVGARFTLVGHPRQDVDGTLVVVRTRAIAASRPGSTSVAVSHVLECVPVAERFRPRRRPKPRIFGTHLAFVVGENDGDEIDVDSYGRVKVEFRWDRRDMHGGKPTRHIRVSQPWAGAGFGFVMLPRVNEEVIVSYIDGDPDEPVIVGRLHNAFVPTPLNLPAQKTRSIWRSRSSHSGGEDEPGFNEIMMEDLKGQEQVYLHAQRNLDEVVLASHSTSVGGDQSNSVGGNRTHSVRGWETVTVGGDRTTLFQSNEHHTVTGFRDTHIGANDDMIVTGWRNIEVGIGQNVTIAGPHQHRCGDYISFAFTAHSFESRLFHVKAPQTKFEDSTSFIVEAAGCVLSMSAGIVVLSNGAGATIALIGGAVFVMGGSTIMSSAGGPITQVSGGPMTMTAGGDISAAAPTIKLNG